MSKRLVHIVPYHRRSRWFRVESISDDGNMHGILNPHRVYTFCGAGVDELENPLTFVGVGNVNEMKNNKYYSYCDACILLYRIYVPAHKQKI